MHFFDITKMPVNLWRNGAGETREICCYPPATRDFAWRASIASIAGNGEFSPLPKVDRVITLIEGGEVTLDGGSAFRHTLRRYQPFAFSAEQPVRAELTEGRMSMDFNIMVHRERCRASVRVADRTFTTFGNHGGIVFVLSGAWQLGDTLLSVDQGAWWQAGHHTLRLLKNQGQLLFTEIAALPGERVA
ncbi:environmental stress-induced protein Ves [Siccibacter colletis]|uniref:Environmental stress-induced protein Ves n=1 Tax=Siccibacter colletis TaxID=1505757 RepID=A0ABY6JIE6_9ENTR|nr:environmental stress-induced protein Ves [Siccibacter colletis]UYU33407.1 environmental stress-induced protein Ves [Siccibacter colletis]